MGLGLEGSPDWCSGDPSRSVLSISDDAASRLCVLSLHVSAWLFKFLTVSRSVYIALLLRILVCVCRFSKVTARACRLIGTLCSEHGIAARLCFLCWSW